MSYINKKTRVFKEAGDIEVQRKRSDGRMKTYQSAIDARAWCDITEDRRQYILDLIRRGEGKGLSLGKFIPIEAIIDILLANKNADIKRLQEENDALREFIKKNGLKYEETPLATSGMEDGREQIAGGREQTADGRDKIAGGREQTADGRDKIADGREQIADGREQTADGREQSADGREQSADGREQISSTPTEKDAKAKGERSGETPDGPESAKSGGPASPTGEDSKLEESGGEISTTPPFVTDTSDISSSEMLSDRDGNKAGARTRRSISKEEEKAAAEFLAGKSPDDQLLALKDALAEKDAYIQSQHDVAVEAIEILETIKDILEDKDTSKPKGRKPSSDRPPTRRPQIISRSIEASTDSCKDEIEALEREIQAMKQNSSPEVEIVKREVEVLKKYCEKLSAIQRENAELKKEREMWKNSASGGNLDDAIKAKLQKLDEITQERDKLKARVRQLEEQLSSYGNLPQEIDSFKRKTNEMLDGDDLQKRLANVRGVDEGVRKLKAKCKATEGVPQEKEKLLARIAGLEKELANLKCKCRDVDIMKVERDCLKVRVHDLERIQRDYEALLKKTQGFDALKAECASYKAKLEEMKKMEDELNELRAKAQRADELENERQMLMKEIQDCECCMTNQEDEIKRLACHIDCLTQNLDKRQDEMKCKVVTLRAHIERKDTLIAKSEQQLADVQDQLRNSIENLACETTCLRNRIEDLEGEVNKYRKDLAEKDESYKILMEKYENEKSNSKQLETELSKAIKNDIHLKQMLKQAKCAVKCITQKLEKHDIGDFSKLDAERNNLLKRIQELENQLQEQQKPCGAERIAELEEELRNAYANIGCFEKCLEEMKGMVAENKSLRRHSTQLQDNAKDQITKLQNEKDDLLRRIKELEEKDTPDDKDKIIEDLKKQVAQCKDDLDKETKLRQDQEETLSSTDDCVKLKKEIEILHAEIDRLNFELERLKKINEGLIAKREGKPTPDISATGSLKAELEKAKTDDGSKGDSLEMDRILKENEILKSELEKLKAENEQLKKGSETKEGETEKGELDKLQNENDQLKKELEKLTMENERLKKENEVLKDELAKLSKEQPKKEDEPVKGEPDELSLENERLKKENELLKDELEKLKNKPAGDKNDEIDKLNKELASKGDLEDENKKLKDEINRLKQEMGSKLKPQPSAEDTKVKDFAKERDELLKQIEAQKKEIADLLDKIKKPSSTEDNLTAQQLDKKNKENENLKSTIADLEKQLKELQQKPKPEVPKSSPEIDKAVKQLKESLENEEKRVRELEENLKKCQDSNNNYKNRIAELEDQIKKLQAKRPSIEKAPESTDGYKNRIKELEDEIAKQKKDCQDTIASLKQQYERDIKNIQQKNKESIDKLQKAQQEALDKLSNEHEDQMSNLKKELRKSEASLSKIKEKQKKEKEKKPEQKAEEPKPEPKVEDKKPEQNVEEPKPEQKVEEPKPEPKVEDKKPEQNVEEPKPEQKVEESKPEPKVEEKKPEKKKEEKKPEKIEEEKIPEPKEKKKPSVKNKIKIKKEKKETRSLLSSEPQLPKEEEKIIDEIPKEEPKPKKLSIKTFGDVCICDKMPTVIPISPVQPTFDQEPTQEQRLQHMPPMPQVTPIPVIQQMPLQQPPMMSYKESTPKFSPMLTPEQAEKFSSLKKIAELENRLLAKQKCTKEKIDNLQNTVEKFKRQLELEKQKNSDLVNRYANQSKTVANMKLEIDLVKRESYQDKRKLHQLNATLKNMLDDAANKMIYPYPEKPLRCCRPDMIPEIPHFHTELTLMSNESYLMAKTTRDKSSDSFGIDE